MKGLRLQRWLAVAGTVCLLIAAIGGLRVYLYSFSGDIVVAKGCPECVAAAPSHRFEFLPSLGHLVQRRVPGGSIPFNDRKTSGKLVDPNAPYDIIALPFSLRLESVNPLEVPEAVEQLRISGPEADSLVTITKGGEVSLGTDKYHVEGIRKWAGLLRDAAGTEMAAVSIRKTGETWTEGIFLDARTWSQIGENMCIRFEWYPSEENASDAVTKGFAGLESARWGAVDGTALNWFDSFVPGTGATLRDGTTVTLLALDEQFATEAGPCPAIQVEISGNGKAHNQWFPANRSTPDDRVRFEWQSRMRFVVLLGAWMDDQAVIAGYLDGQLRGTKTLNWDETWTSEEMPYEIRVDQVLERAVPVKREDSPLYEAILKSGNEELHLRQGESVRIEDYLVEFVRKADAPAVQYTLSAIDAAGGSLQKITIGPEDTVTVGPWSFSQGAPSRNPLHVASLKADYAFAHGWLRIPLALALGFYVVFALQLGADRSSK